jgi:hypothetical protein
LAKKREGGREGIGEGIKLDEGKEGGKEWREGRKGRKVTHKLV